MAVFSLDKKENQKAIGQGALQGGGSAALGGFATGASIGAGIGAAAGGVGAIPGALIGGLIGAGATGAIGGGIGAAEAGTADVAAQKDKFKSDQDIAAAKQDAQIDAQALSRAGGTAKARRAPNAALQYVGDTSPGYTSYDEWKV